MIQEEIYALKHKIASTLKAKRPFVFDQPAASGEEVDKMIVLTATNRFSKQEYLTALVPSKLRHINFAEWTNKMDQAKKYCIIYYTKLKLEEMENM